MLRREGDSELPDVGNPARVLVEARVVGGIDDRTREVVETGIVEHEYRRGNPAGWRRSWTHRPD